MTHARKHGRLPLQLSAHLTPAGKLLSKSKVLKCAMCHIDVAAPDIIHHYSSQHNIDGLKDFEYFKFENEDLFHAWKKSIEKRTACRYSKAIRIHQRMLQSNPSTVTDLVNLKVKVEASVIAKLKERKKLMASALPIFI